MVDLISEIVIYYHFNP